MITHKESGKKKKNSSIEVLRGVKRKVRHFPLGPEKNIGGFSANSRKKLHRQLSIDRTGSFETVN